MTVIAKNRCVFSPCRRYRYTLWRDADPFGEGYCMFIGLNPSTADECVNDPTVRRCIRYSRDWGYKHFVMTNIFAWRDVDPRGMKAADDPIGPENNNLLMAAAEGADIVVAAWGVHGVYRDRDKWAIKHLPRLCCLGLTKDGHPKHPLYCKADLVPVAFTGVSTG